jgi:site-specific DNA recombinase
MKRYVALARVSSREQEREGFSLAVQEEALRRYVDQHGGELVRLFRIAETASKRDERRTFKEMIAYAKKHCAELDGLLFYKVDRAARNLFDYVELERLESEYDVPFISVSQQTDNNPAGRMMRRTLANMASFYTEQMAVDIRQGLARRVKEGWFVGRPPYGYRNIRHSGRSIVEVEERSAINVRRIFHLYAYENLTLEGVALRLGEEGAVFTESVRRFSRTTIHTILTDRSYIGEVRYRGQWYPGKQSALVDRAIWNRVQTLLGGRGQSSHEMTYASDLIQCAHCGYRITGETKTKQTRNGERVYHYYRCTYYNKPGHPRTRVTEAELDQQVLALFDRMRIESDDVRDWFRTVLVSKTKDDQQESLAKRSELQRQSALLVAQQDRLLNLRIDDQIDQDTFAQKQTELRDRLAGIKLQLDAVDRTHDETAEIAVKVFELSQTLRQQWLTADYAAKRRILEIVWLNCQLNDATLVPTIRKPFDVLVEGPHFEKSGGGGN